MHLLAGHKRLKDEYKELDMLPKVKKTNMAGTVEAIKEYLRPCCGVMKASRMDFKKLFFENHLLMANDNSVGAIFFIETLAFHWERSGLSKYCGKCF